MKLSKSILTAVIIGALLIGGLGGWLLSLLAGRNFVPSEKHEDGYQYISPLLECNPTGIENYDTVGLKQSLQKLIEERIRAGTVSHVSVYFRDLNNGPWIGIAEEENFSPASLLKVPLMIAYLKMAEKDPGLLEKRITVKTYAQPGLGFTQNVPPADQVQAGEEYTVDELLRFMIVFSDNNASNALIENANPEDLGRLYEDLKISPLTPGETENFMTVLEYSSFFRILYNSSYLNRAMSEKALSLLAQSKFNDGLVAGLPAGTTIAHKFGERGLIDSKQLHDCGIIYLRDGRHYLACIMTRGDNLPEMSATIADLSRIIYEGFRKFTK